MFNYFSIFVETRNLLFNPNIMQKQELIKLVKETHISSVFDYLDECNLTETTNGATYNNLRNEFINSAILPQNYYTRLEMFIKTIDEKFFYTPQKEVEQNTSIPVIYTETPKPNLTCDIPPDSSFWVGREKELNEIKKSIYKIVFISGIGGQGKSSIASHYVKEIVEGDSYWEYWDWRDCKEEGNRLHTKVISIIERLTNGVLNSTKLKDCKFDDLLSYFLETLGNRRIVFVFDNIDAYVQCVDKENEEFRLTGNIAILFNKVLNNQHNSKFIFTCRTSVNEAAINLLNLHLEGLSIQETQELFKKYEIKIKPEKLQAIIKRSFDLTMGHPLWLSLIAAQAVSSEDNANKLIESISKHGDLSSELADTILRTVWNILTPKQQILLRGMAEIVKSETAPNIAKILEDELDNYNQFNKALKALKRLNLIVTKSNENVNETCYELHPLVKEYVKSKYSRKDRSKFIVLFMGFYDSFIHTLKRQISFTQPLSFYEYWIAKIELAVNNEDFKLALITLQEIYSSMLGAGYSEEYIRIAYNIFLNVNWQEAILEEYSYFRNQFTEYIRTLIEIGRNDEAIINLKKYERLISKGGVDYIEYCDLMCYNFWYIDNFTKAISYAEEGLELKNSLKGTNTISDIAHSLALAWRDSKEYDNVQKAMAYFSNGENIDTILEKIKQEHNYTGQLLGNLGRCLFFLDNIEGAINLYKASLSIIFSHNNSDVLLNKGYASLWIAECLEVNKDFKNSLYFYLYAKNCWAKVTPIRIKLINSAITNLLKKNKNLNSITDCEEREIEKYCKKWLGV